ncbi:cohesin domain-containing protein [Aphanothece sacrum]|nr:cohesin domain-containing protein [Aphanothece sacrum]
MGKNWGVGLVLASLPTVLMGQIAQAVSLQLIPSSTNITVGQNVTVAVVISDLGNKVPPSLSFYDLDINFNPSILSFNNAIFGNQLNLNNLGTSPITIPGNGVVSIWEASGDSDTDLDTLQLGSFTLATLSFKGIGVGNSALNISITEILDSQLAPLTINSVTDSSVRVNSAVTKIPEPSLNLGFLGLMFLSRIVFKKAQLFK